MSTIGQKILLTTLTATVLVGLFLGTIARAVTRLVCGTVTFDATFITGLRVVVFGDTSVVHAPEGCTVPLTGIRLASGVLFLVLAALAAWGASLWWRWRQSDAYFVHEIKNRTGFAKRHEIRKHASAKAMLARASTVRPGLVQPRVTDVAWPLGKSLGQDVYVSVEDSIVLEGPPRSGKGYRLLIGAIIDWSGPLITTSTRSDNLTATLTARQARGDVAVFDPQRLAGLDTGLRVSPITGCEDPLTADQRAQAIIKGTGLGTSSTNQEWAEAASGVLARLLHACAVSGGDVATLHHWGSNPVMAHGAVDVLRSDGAPGWGDELAAILDDTSNLLASTWFGVKGAIRPLGIPSIREAMTPTAGHQFDPEEFLTGWNTLYLIGTGSGAGSVGGYLGALLDDIVETARRKALASPGSRLANPLGLVLDEIANMFTWPALPRIMADGGGIGISPLVVLQALSQAETAWSKAEADTIWSAATAKVVLGGASDVTHLRDLEALLGTRNVSRSSTTYADNGDSVGVQKERVPVMTLDELRRMPQELGLLAYKNRRGILLDLAGWTERADAADIKAGRARTEAAQLATFRSQYEGRNR